MTAGVDLAAPRARGRARGALIARLRGARHVLAVSHENPDADTLGAVLGVCLLVEALGGQRDGALHGRRAAALRVPAGHRPVPHGPGPGRSPTTCWSSPTARARSGSAPSRRRQPGAVRRPAARDHRPPRVQRRRRRPRTGSTPAPPRPASSSTLLAVRLGVPLDLGDGALAAALMAGHRHGHGHLRPPERHAADARGVGGAGRGRARRSPTSRAASTGPSPTPSCGCSAACWTGSQTSPDRRVIWSTLPRGDLAATGADPGALRGDHRPPRPVRDRRGGDAVQGAGRRDDAALASGRSPAAWTRRR